MNPGGAGQHDPQDDPPPSAPGRRRYPEDVPRLADVPLEVVSVLHKQEANHRLLAEWHADQQRITRLQIEALGAASEAARGLETRWQRTETRLAKEKAA